jgi:ATP-grasp domain
VRAGAADDLPEVAEADVNPVVAGPAGVEMVDARVRIGPAAHRRGPIPRRVR